MIEVLIPIAIILMLVVTVAYLLCARWLKIERA